ncbi:uncharacterized protein PRCAT00003363001 [Priceomyces carsonii]|uniref:uncharacterized protein n=1 Tax=Priceomyces carsonii TaxID=28549 RepID=UPI002ED99B00|nr:unnamed protein product [Priceomyces carsonii]
MSKLSTSQTFLKAIGAKIPIIQAPMAGISTPELSYVVQKTGGIGSIPFGGVDLTKGIGPLVKLIEDFKSLSSDSNIVNLNFFCHDYKEQARPLDEQKKNWISLLEESSGSVIGDLVNFRNANVSLTEIEDRYLEIFSELLQYLCDYRPKMVSFHFGHPSKNAISILKDNQIMVFVTATSVLEAKYLVDLGVDGLILQGFEAGGHRGNFLTTTLLDECLSTSALFKQVKRHLGQNADKVHLVPSGGIVDGETIASYLSQGASAVQLGTTFLTVPESNSSDFIKNRILQHNGEPTIMTSLVSGKPARALRTKFLKDLVSYYDKTPTIQTQPPYGWAYSAYKQLAQIKKDPQLGFYLAGQNYTLIDPTLNTEQVMKKLSSEINNKNSST